MGAGFGGTAVGSILSVEAAPATGWVEFAPVLAAARPARERSGFDPNRPSLPVLKNSLSPWAISFGSWNRRSGSLAIIFATSAASSAGTSGRTRFSGVASIE